MTIKDFIYYNGLDYNTAVQFAGDGLASNTAYWEKSLITVCQCDYGYFGPDCSQGK
jgi:hypothetical protein